MLFVRVRWYAVVRLMAALGLVAGLAAGCNDGPEAGLFQQDGRNLDIVDDDASESDTAPVVDTSVEVDTVVEVDSVDTADIQTADSTDVVDTADADVADTEDTEDTTPEEDTTPAEDTTPWVAPIGDGCTTDDQCTDGTRCDPLYNVCVECIAATECGPNARCSRWKCVPATWCTTDTDCDGSDQGQACKPHEQYCIPCYKDWHCGDEQVCRYNQCVDTGSCSNSLDCPGEMVCTEHGRCTDCVENADCGDGNHCLRPWNECVPLCDSDNDCKDIGMVCGGGGYCKPPLNTELAPTEVECDVHGDCPGPDYYCGATGGIRRCKSAHCVPEQRRCALLCREFGLHCGQLDENSAPSQCGDSGLWGTGGDACERGNGQIGAPLCVVEEVLSASACESLACDSSWSICLSANNVLGCFPGGEDTFTPRLKQCPCANDACLD